MQHRSEIERLLAILRNRCIHRPFAVHNGECRYPRMGKQHGPCICGARQLDVELRQALIDCGVSVSECPDEVRERVAM